MPRLRVHNLAMSLDGYVAGPDQSADNPLGVRGEELHEWVFATRSGRAMQGMDGGGEGVDDRFIAAGDAGIGATAGRCSTSAAKDAARPPSPSINATVSSSCSCVRDDTITLAPAAASACAIARPTPRPPPVTSATCPSSSPVM